VNNITSGSQGVEGNITAIRNTLIAVTIVFVGIITIMFGMLYNLRNRPRKKEFGILKAIGFTKSNILTLTSVEMMRVALPAFIISIVLSIILMLLGNSVSGQEYFSITLYSVLVGLLICVIVVVAAGMLPVYNAIKVAPIDAIRKINQ
jgi:ABC-type antimicrobial peptide transport system permease subunit